MLWETHICQGTAPTTTIAAIADRVYRDLAPALLPAARLSTLAHVERLIALGLARGEGDLRTDGVISAV